MAAIVVDLNNSGILHLYRRVEEPETTGEIIHSEGLDA